MKYFIPAWHKQYDDWSINIPSIENYDAAEYMTVLKKFDEKKIAGFPLIKLILPPLRAHPKRIHV